MSYTHLLFDMDDTILDFQKAQYMSFQCVLETYHIHFTEESYHLYEEINHQLWGEFDSGLMSKDFVQNTRFARFFEQLGHRIDGTEANSIYQNFLSSQTWLMPYAKEVCAELSSNYKLFIITNGVGATQEKRFRSSDIFPYFSDIFVSEDIGIAKPNKEFFVAVFDSIGDVAHNKVMLIGDSLTSDIQGANNMGIDCCWYNPNACALPSNFKIKFQIADLRQLLSLL